MSVLSCPMAKNQTKQTNRQAIVSMWDIWANKVFFFMYVCVLTSWAGMRPFFWSCLSTPPGERGGREDPHPIVFMDRLTAVPSFSSLVAAEGGKPRWKTNCSRESDFFGGLFDSYLFVSCRRCWLTLKKTKEQSRAKRGEWYRKVPWDLGSLTVQRPKLVDRVSTRQVYCMSWWRYLAIFRATMTPFVSLFLYEKGDIEGKQNVFRPYPTLLRAEICRSAAWVCFARTLPARKVWIQYRKER